MVPEPERRFKLTSGFPSRRRAGSWPTLGAGAVLRRSGLEFGFEVGTRMIDAFGLRRIIVAGGFGVIGSSFVHHMVREDPARR